MALLTPEQRTLGRENANTALGVTRRDFLKAAAVAPAMGAFYFGYTGVDKPVRAAIIGTGAEGCNAMIHEHNRAFIDYIGFCDARPSHQKRAIDEFTKHPDYPKADVEKLKKYDDVDKMLDDPDVELVVIALPLWLHAPVAIKAMQKGKHVFCEKLMAHNVGQCKAMVTTAHDKNRLLAIGHQRHYSALYDNANYFVQNGHLGEIRHIRASWHRNQAVPRLAKDKAGNYQYDQAGNPVYVRDDAGNIVYFDSWKPAIPPEDVNVDFKKYGYKSVDELVRWRLYNRTGAGLMAELGSHQLDACSIFLGKVHPLAVTGIGGQFFYTDGREVDDHVFVNFEFPGKSGPTGKDHVVVTYSSINTNKFDKYGETVMGTRGTMIVEEEREILFYKEPDPNPSKSSGAALQTSITVEKPLGGKPTIEASPSAAGPTAAASLGTLALDAPSRGYREELEHFAYCIRNGNKDNYHETTDDKFRPRCRGEVALADAVIALTSNLAMREKRRIDFKESWFDWKSPEVPDKSEGDLDMGKS
ncbi:MAG: putative dehydrogenase [Planctomycetota bacterium]|nr:putative dehydrogenase [Planctomycetota bacterium]